MREWVTTTLDSRGSDTLGVGRCFGWGPTDRNPTYTRFKGLHPSSGETGQAPRHHAMWVGRPFSPLGKFSVLDLTTPSHDTKSQPPHPLKLLQNKASANLANLKAQFFFSSKYLLPIDCEKPWQPRLHLTSPPSRSTHSNPYRALPSSS